MQTRATRKCATIFAHLMFSAFRQHFVCVTALSHYALCVRLKLSLSIHVSLLGYVVLFCILEFHSFLYTSIRRLKVNDLQNKSQPNRSALPLFVQKNVQQPLPFFVHLISHISLLVISCDYVSSKNCFLCYRYVHRIING